jgi:hypothetical protein
LSVTGGATLAIEVSSVLSMLVGMMRSLFVAVVGLEPRLNTS